MYYKQPLRKAQQTAVQQYIPGGSQTTVSGGEYAQGPDLMGLLARKLAQRPAPLQTAPRVVAPRVQEPSPEQHAAKSPLQLAEERSRILQLQAMENGPPLRMVSGPGIVPGYMPDTLKMNAYQRKIFLPESSTNDPYRDAVANDIEKKGNADEFEEFRKRSGGYARSGPGGPITIRGSDK